MIRSQILLSPEIEKQIKDVSRNLGISRSNLVRKLLNQSLGLNSNSPSRTQILSQNAMEILDLATFNRQNPRISGFREVFSVGGKTAEVRILDDNIFRYYIENKILPSSLNYEILKNADNLKDFSLTNTLAVRRAYIVPGLENPPGPRFLGVKPQNILDYIFKIYDFAIDHGYHLVKNSRICVFFHPFYDPKPIEIPIDKKTILPYGGYAAPLNTKITRVEILATWGNNEGVQSFDSIDRYVVNTQRKIIIEKDIPQKIQMLCTTTKSQSEKVNVPQNKQFEQVLSDVEILEVARVISELGTKYGLRRIEFSFDGKGDLIFNESAPYKIIERSTQEINKKGFIKVVSDEGDIKKLADLKKTDIEKTIVYIDKNIIEKRAYDVLNSIASLPAKFTVFYPGLSATAHAMRILNDFGHLAIVVGNRIFKEDEEVIVKTINGQISIVSLVKGDLSEFSVNLFDAKLYDKEFVGGKAFNLSILKSKGFNVPHGFVLTSNLFQKKGLFDQKWGTISDFYKLDSKKKYAIRSSANVEDAISHSFAGQFDSYLNVPLEKIPEKVMRVVSSQEKESVKKYVIGLGKDFNIKMAVVVQEMIDPDKAGVIFGKDLQTGNEDLIVIDVTKGLGQGVVEGTAESQRTTYSRSKDEFSGKEGSKNLLTGVETDTLIEMLRSVENLIGGTQDIEWAIDIRGLVWIIQSRGIA